MNEGHEEYPDLARSLAAASIAVVALNEMRKATEMYSKSLRQADAAHATAIRMARYEYATRVADIAQACVTDAEYGTDDDEDTF